MRKGSSAAAIALAILLAAPVADACRVRRAPNVAISGVPTTCSHAFVAKVRVGGNPPVRSVDVKLDGRVVRHAGDDTDVTIACGRLSAGRHVLSVDAKNSSGRSASRSLAFRAQ